MLGKQEEACVMIIASVCAQDGLISQAEEQAIFDGLKTRYPFIKPTLFDSYMNSFFESNNSIEDYLAQVTDEDLRSFTIKLSEKSASADGLDFRENVALKKVKIFWST